MKSLQAFTGEPAGQIFARVVRGGGLEQPEDKEGMSEQLH